jgi:hypothetical protein
MVAAHGGVSVGNLIVTNGLPSTRKVTLSRATISISLAFGHLSQVTLPSGNFQAMSLVWFFSTTRGPLAYGRMWLVT